MTTHRAQFPALLSLVLLTSCATKAPTTEPPIPAVTGFALERYLGRWYEIARMPHWFERDMDFVRAEYSRRPDGRIRVVNSGTKNGKVKDATAVAKFKGDPSVGELRVSFFRPFYGDYRILALDQDYTQVIVGSSGKDFLWILARTPTIPQEDLDRHLAQLKAWGYDTTKLEYPKQQ